MKVRSSLAALLLPVLVGACSGEAETQVASLDDAAGMPADGSGLASDGRMTGPVDASQSPSDVASNIDKANTVPETGPDVPFSTILDVSVDQAPGVDAQPQPDGTDDVFVAMDADDAPAAEAQADAMPDGVALPDSGTATDAEAAADAEAGVDAACDSGVSCGNSCNTTVLDTCSNISIPCGCDALHYCSGTPGTCLLRKICAAYTTRQAGQQCSNGGAFDDGSGSLLACPCLTGYCISGNAPNGTIVNGTTIGTCCTDTSFCGPLGITCPASVPNTCTQNPASQRNCRTNCTAGQSCDTVNNTCYSCNSLTPPANGNVNAPCSNGAAMWTDPAGNSISLTCKCDVGEVCVNGTNVVTGTTKGTCCLNGATCPAGSATHCMVTGIPNDDCTGKPLTCGVACASGKHCSGPNGACVDDNNCSNIGAVMVLPSPSQMRGSLTGYPCNDNGTFYVKTGGGFFNCPCTQYANSTCLGDGTSSEGVCGCVPTTCSTAGSCERNGQPNGCGGSQACPCASGASCINHSCVVQ